MKNNWFDLKRVPTEEELLEKISKINMKLYAKDKPNVTITNIFTNTWQSKTYEMTTYQKENGVLISSPQKIPVKAHFLVEMIELAMSKNVNLKSIRYTTDNGTPLDSLKGYNTHKIPHLNVESMF